MKGRVERSTVELPNGMQIALLCWGGSGPPILMHHANGFCGALWDATATALSDRFRVYAMDARGHGDSSKPEPPGPYVWARFAEDVGYVARAIAAEQGVRQLRAGVGNSFGGTAMLLASRVDPPFEELVLFDPVFPPPSVDGTPHARGSDLAEGARKRRDHWSSREEARSWFGEKELFQSWESWAIDTYVAEALALVKDGVTLKCLPEIEAAVFFQGSSMDLREPLAEVKVPACLARSRRGHMSPERFARYASRVPNGRLVEIDAGHLAPMEAPAIVAQLVRDTLHTGLRA